MPIDVYPTHIEATEGGDVLFTLKTFDAACAELTVNALVAPQSLDELFAAIRQGVELLQLSAEASESEGGQTNG